MRKRACVVLTAIHECARRNRALAVQACARMPVDVCVASDAEGPACASSNARMSGSRASVSENVARNVLSTCEAIDAASRLVSVTRDDLGSCRVRIRAGDVHTLASLKRALGREMPLSRIVVTESFIDGTLEAEVTVYAHRQERRLARSMARRSRVVRWCTLVFIGCILSGIVAWMHALHGQIGLGRSTKAEL